MYYQFTCTKLNINLILRLATQKLNLVLGRMELPFRNLPPPEDRFVSENEGPKNRSFKICTALLLPQES